MMGIERSDLDDIELGLKQLPSEAYIRFAMFFYDHLDPGMVAPLVCDSIQINQKERIPT